MRDWMLAVAAVLTSFALAACVGDKPALPTCPDQLLSCAGRCIDPASDATHCGASGRCDDAVTAGSAGVACFPNQQCVAARCELAVSLLSIPVEADTYGDVDHPGSPYGVAEELLVANSTSGAPGGRRALLRFDVSSLHALDVIGVALRLVASSGDLSAAARPKAYFVADDAWDETTVDATSMPGADTVALGELLPDAAVNAALERPVQTAFFQGLAEVVSREAAGDGKITLQLDWPTGSAAFRSREYLGGARAATLEVYATAKLLESSCENLANLRAYLPDGEYQLYLDGSPDRPYSAYCDHMATAPQTYLTLAKTGGDFNYSHYVGTAASLRTDYGRIRFDPATALVDLADQRFAVTTGTSDSWATSMPYGTAASCTLSGSGSANIDLEGLPFKIGSTWALNGFFPSGVATFGAGQRTVDVTGGGNCGWHAPTGEPDPSSLTATSHWWYLQLDYAP